MMRANRTGALPQLNCLRLHGTRAQEIGVGVGLSDLVNLLLA
jgi:hypothetical protein